MTSRLLTIPGRSPSWTAKGLSWITFPDVGPRILTQLVLDIICRRGLSLTGRDATSPIACSYLLPAQKLVFLSTIYMGSTWEKFGL